MQNPTKRVLIACILALFIFSGCKKHLSLPVNATDSVIETEPSSHVPVKANVIANSAGYYKSLPARYDSSSKKYPMILFLHGVGELGTDLSNMNRVGLPRLLNRKEFPPDFEVNGHHFSFIVISPQFRKWPTNDDVHAMIKYATTNFRVDTSRIYVTGLSMGGGVTWDYASEYGASLAAISPISGGSYPEKKKGLSIASFNLPVWAFHNADDNTVPVSFTVDFVQNINSHNPAVKAKYTVWLTGGHDAWTKASNPSYKEDGKNMYEWMLQFSREKSKG